MHKILSFLYMAVFFCAGCTTTGTEQVKPGELLLLKNTNFVSSFDQIPYEPITIGDPLKFEFDQQTTILLAGNERRFAKGFTLPASQGVYSVHITSNRQGTLDDPAIMYPEVAILNQEYKVIRKLPPDTFVLRTTMSETGLNAVFFVNNNSLGERYVLITNRPIAEADLVVAQDNVTGQTVVALPLYGGFFMWFIPTGSNKPPIKMKASPIGSLAILLQSYCPRKAGDD